MTAQDAPRTLFGAIERDLRDVAFDAAMSLALATTKAGSRERTRACELARQQYDVSRATDTFKLVDYLGEHFGVPHPMTARRTDDRDLVAQSRIEDVERALYREGRQD